MKRLACLAAALLLPTTALAQSAQDPSMEPGCRPSTGVVVGALLGALIGGAAGGSHNRGQRVLAGAALGAAAGGIGCVAFKTKVTQQRSNAEVERQYATRVRGAAGAPVLIRYDTQPAAPAFSLGEEIALHSHMVLALPDEGVAPDVSEHYTITTPDGHSKSFDKVVGQSGGEMTNDLTFTLPTAMPRGVYQVQTELRVADKVVGQRATSFQVL